MGAGITQRYDIVIVGAGAAGLAAALRLATSGLRIVLIEARDRIGGRAWSIDAPTLEMPVEIGPEFVHGNPEVTLRLLARYGLETIPTVSESWHMQAGSGVAEPETDEQIAVLMQRAYAALDPEVDRTLADALAQVSSAAAAPLVGEIYAMAKGFDAADPCTLSFRAIHEEWQGDASLSTDSARVIHGYRALWNALAHELAALGVTFLLQSSVSSIRYDCTDGVEISLVRWGEHSLIGASRCIVTVPLGVMQRSAHEGGIAFAPALPPAYADAFTRLAMGPVVKAQGLFAQPFWETLDQGRYRDASFFRAPNESPFRTFWTTLPRRSALLTGWAGGSDVAGVLQADKNAIIAAYFHSIDLTFGTRAGEEARAHCRWVQINDWQRDSHSFGAYSYARVDGLKARTILRQPLFERLYFAGEAYAPKGEAGTVAGALATGEEAADHMLTF